MKKYAHNAAASFLYVVAIVLIGGFFVAMSEYSQNAKIAHLNQRALVTMGATLGGEHAN